MKSKQIVYLWAACILLFLAFMAQTNRISDLKDQLAIARFAATENERVVDVLVEGNWAAVNSMKNNINSCNQMLIDQAKHTETVEKKVKKHVESIKNLKARIAESDDICAGTDIPDWLQPHQ